MRARKLPCGCLETDTHYTALCDPHKAEYEEIRKRWAEEKIANSIPRNYEVPHVGPDRQG
jgi:benzoyl-CoA reductase/2-hydroxyglutaryl-CoA dehydratase subunit BcrC/BadD/HgdB